MVDESAGPSGDSVVESVLSASRALVAVSARSIAAVRGVTLPQYRMLVVLSGGSRNLSALAEQLDVAPSTALRMVDRLVDAGSVRRETPAGDRRQTLLSLTPAGRRTVRTVTNRRRRDLTAVLERLPEDRRLEVGRAMGEFARAAEQLWGPGAGFRVDD